QNLESRLAVLTALPGHDDAQGVARGEARRGDALRKGAGARADRRRHEIAVAVVLGVRVDGARRLAARAEKIEISVAVEIVNDEDVVERMPDLVSLPIRVDRARVLVPPAAA